MKAPFVSVIIPALNAEKTITRCLKAIMNLNFPKNRLEIIVVDNGSKDKTLEIAKKFDTRIFIKPHLSIGELRNFGAERAKGSILAFMDSDVLVPRKWLKIGIPYLNKKNVGMIGSVYTIPKNSSRIAKVWESLRKRKITGDVSELDWLPGGNILIKKSVFDDMEGFSNIQACEDVDFGLRLREKGYKIVSDKRLKSVHLGEPQSMGQFLNKRVWQSSHSVELFRRHKNKRLLLFMFSLYHLLCVILFIVSLFIKVITNNSIMFIMAVVLLVLPSIILAIKNGFKMGRYRYIPTLMLVYFLWGLGYGISIVIHRQWRYLTK